MRRLVLVAAAALALGACLPRKPVPQTTEGDWAIARDASSRRAYLYDGWDHRATATATHLSLAVREARARRLAAWYGWTPEELERRLAQERKEAAEGEEFLLSLFTAQTTQNDLDAPRSIWRVAVKVDGADVLARTMTAVEHDATVVGLFPFIGHFDVAYRVILPAAPGGALGGRRFTLRLSSALGMMDLEFGDGTTGSLRPERPR